MQNMRSYFSSWKPLLENIVRRITVFHVDLGPVEHQLHQLQPGRSQAFGDRRKAHDRHIDQTHGERLPTEATDLRTQQSMVRPEQQPSARLPAIGTHWPL